MRQWGEPGGKKGPLEEGAVGISWRKNGTTAFLLVLVSLFFWTSPRAEHTPSTKEGEIRGLPAWCCNMRDCKPADVRLLRIEGKTPIILVNGSEYKVVGQYGDGRRGLFVTPDKQTYWCPMWGDKARCALIRPLGEM